MEEHSHMIGTWSTTPSADRWTEKRDVIAVTLRLRIAARVNNGLDVLMTMVHCIMYLRENCKLVGVMKLGDHNIKAWLLLWWGLASLIATCHMTKCCEEAICYLAN